METNKVSFISIKPKVLAQITAGVFGGTILGITGFTTMTGLGAYYGCWAFIDSIFGGAGYESCGPFGGIVGILIGVMLGILIIGKSKIIKYPKVVLWLSIGSFLLPILYFLLSFLYGAILSGAEYKSGDVFASLSIISTGIIAFVIASAIPSIFITWVINWQNSRKA